MKKVIVTGANGFIGYWLLRELVSNNVNVVAVVKDEEEDISCISGLKGVRIVYCDLNNISHLEFVIKEYGFDAFYHLAWISSRGVGRADYDLQLSNVRYACDVVKVAKNLQCKKILFAGTITEKIAENILNIPEKAENNIYGICKHTTHCLVDIECKKYNMPYIWMQFANTFGPNSIDGNIVGYAVKELLNNREARFGPAAQPYDVLYVKDLVYAAYLLGEKSTSKKSYYIGSGKPRILSEWLFEIAELCNKSEFLQIGARPDDGLKYDISWFAIDDLMCDTGFYPRYDFRSGIQEMLNYINNISE